MRELGGSHAGCQPHYLRTRDGGIDDEPGVVRVVERHRLVGDREVETVTGDELVEDVELRLRLPVHLRDPAVAHDDRRRGVVRRVERDEPELGVLHREAVEVDALGVHEAEATDGHDVDSASVHRESAATAASTSCSDVPPLTPMPPTTRPPDHSGTPPPKAM